MDIINTCCLEADASPFSKSRITKDAFEIKTLRKASSIILWHVHALCAKSIKTGQKESQLTVHVLMKYAMEREMFDTGYFYLR